MAFFKTMWKNNSKHKKLPEELFLQNVKDTEQEPNEILDLENDVVTFKLKYLGSTVVEKISSENISTEAVKNIIKTAKAAKGRKKLQRVNVNISLKGIAVTDLLGNDILKISIYRISNCSTDATHRQIFSFISTNADETTECHAFLCSKRKIAETVTLAVAQAFSSAYEAWRELPSGITESEKNIINRKENEKNNINQETIKPIEIEEKKINHMEEEKLIDFDDDSCEPEEDPFIFEPTPPRSTVVASKWVCFDDDFSSGTPSKTNFNAFNKVDLILA